MKKIFSIAPCGNDNAQFVGVDYIKFSISQIEDACDWMRKTDEIAQPLLANIDLLLIISKKYPVDANLLIEKDKVEEWKNTFNDWFERVSNKIPAKFRDGIKTKDYQQQHDGFYLPETKPVIKIINIYVSDYYI